MAEEILPWLQQKHRTTTWLRDRPQWLPERPQWSQERLRWVQGRLQRLQERLQWERERPSGDPASDHNAPEPRWRGRHIFHWSKGLYYYHWRHFYSRHFYPFLKTISSSFKSSLEKKVAIAIIIRILVPLFASRGPGSVATDRSPAAPQIDWLWPILPRLRTPGGRWKRQRSILSASKAEEQPL